MSKRNIVHSFILPLFALTMVFLFSAVVNAQKGPQGTTGAPLKGVDVKLGKNPGGSPAARATTDKDGNFAFPVVPAGEYILTLELKKDKPDTKLDNTVAQMNERNMASVTATNASVKFCYITLNLPGGKKVEMGYDLAKKKAFDSAIDPTQQSTSKTINLQDFIVVSDGATPLTGAVVRSKSNITNN